MALIWAEKIFNFGFDVIPVILLIFLIEMLDVLFKLSFGLLDFDLLDDLFVPFFYHDLNILKLLPQLKLDILRIFHLLL